MDEKELIHKIADNDQLAFKYLVDRYQNLVIKTCYRLIGNQRDAEDVAQEVFFQIYKSAKNFRAEAKLSSWIYRIAVNRSLNFLRDQKRNHWLKSLSSTFNDKSETATEMIVNEADRPDSNLEAKERSHILQKAIDCLSEKQRVAFTLHKFQGLTYQEIADVMQRSVASVESLIHRAKLNLQKRLVKVLKEI